MKKQINIASLPVDCSRLCCNFVNTLYSWKKEDTYDYFEDYDIFIEWCRKLDVCKEDQLRRLNRRSKEAPGEALLTLDTIRHIRFLLHQLISAVAAKDKQKIEQSLAAVNPFIADALGGISLDFGDSAFTISYPEEKLQLISPVWPVLKSLYDLLTEDPIDRIKECPTCGWVFLDETRNGRRRWCNPLNCGTKDKMDRYLKKKTM